MGRRSFITADISSFLEEKTITRVGIEDSFTDRESPTARFKEVYENYFAEDSTTPQAIQFYGVGGSGKSTIIKSRLIPYINSLDKTEALDLHPYVYYDFAGMRTKAEFFRSMIMDLCSRYKMIFPYTQIALLRIAALEKDEGKAKEMKEFLDSCFPLKKLLNPAEIAAIFVQTSTPLFLIWESATRAVNSIGSALVDRIRDRFSKKDLTKTSILNATDSEFLKSRLQLYFAKDLELIESSWTHPLVLFLDTYEDYVKLGDTICDNWMRSRTGIPGLLNTSDVLLVIAGRNRLSEMERSSESSWYSYQKENRFEEILLGGLSYNDCCSYFDKVGIGNENLRTHIFNIAREDETKPDCGALPVILDICYNVFLSLSHDEKAQSDVSNYGINKEELIHRYLEKDMPSCHRNLALALSHLSWWTDEEVSKIGITADISEYEDFLKHSFIITNADGSYSMHSVIKGIISRYAEMNYPKQKVEILEKAIDYLKDFSDFKSVYEYVRLGVEHHRESKSGILKFYKESNIAEKVRASTKDDKGKDSFAEDMFKILSLFPDNISPLIVYSRNRYKLSFLSSSGRYEEAIELCEKSAQACSRLYSPLENSKDFWLGQQAELHLRIGDYSSGLNLSSSLIEALETYKTSDELKGKMEKIAAGDASQTVEGLVIEFGNRIDSRIWNRKLIQAKCLVGLARFEEAKEILTSLGGDNNYIIRHHIRDSALSLLVECNCRTQNYEEALFYSDKFNSNLKQRVRTVERWLKRISQGSDFRFTPSSDRFGEYIEQKRTHIAILTKLGKAKELEEATMELKAMEATMKDIESLGL